MPSTDEEITKSEFITEIQNRGEIDVSNVSIGYKVVSKWFKIKEGFPIQYNDGEYIISISNLPIRNPPTSEEDIDFKTRYYKTITTVDRAWALARINELPFTSPITPPSPPPLPEPATANITFDSSPKGAHVRVDGVLIGDT